LAVAGKLLIVERKRMDHNQANRLSCVVCGIETKRHAGWFLVMDNCWLDRVRVLSWHPALAREGRMRGVCGKEHLKTLLTHWLNHANLQLIASGTTPWPPPALDARQSGSNYSASSMGKVVGELAVQRESPSRIWTGSPEARECILNALIGEMENQTRGTENPLPDRSVGYSREYAFY
jgi:hypothetical protein